MLKLVREKYGEGEGERFGPTLAAEHLASEDGMRIDAETLRRWMLAEGLWRRRASASRIGSGASGGGTLGSWCRWTEAFTTGWRSEVRAAA